MSTSLAVMPCPSSPVTTIPLSFRRLCLRAHRLGIPPGEGRPCATIGALQRLARPRYLALARRLHPDMLTHRGRPFRKPRSLGARTSAGDAGVGLAGNDTLLTQ